MKVLLFIFVKCKIYINHFAMCIYDLRTINIMDTKLKWMDDLRNLSGRKNVISLFLYFIRGCLCQIIFEMLRLKGQCFSGFIICQAFCFTNMINQLQISFVNVKTKHRHIEAIKMDRPDWNDDCTNIILVCLLQKSRKRIDI